MEVESVGRVRTEPARTIHRAATVPLDYRQQAERLYRHAGFRPALAEYCSAMAKPAPIAWPVYKLFDQFGRYVVCYMLIHNYYAWRHAGGLEPTLTALQRVAGASERHTAGFVAVLKAGKFVTTEDNPADRRQKLLRPAAPMVAGIGRSVRLFIAAADAIEGHPVEHSDIFGECDVLGEVLRRSAAYTLLNGTLLHGFPTVLHFAEHDCGYPLLSAVIGAHYARTLAGAPAAVPLDVRALAQRFQVSPAHIRNMLDEAERHGWFSLGPDGGSVSTALVTEFERWSAGQMAHFRDLADEVRGPRH